MFEERNWRRDSERGRVTAVRLREWRGVKPVAGPSGAAITTRLRTTAADKAVLDAVAGHLGWLRRADLARVCRPTPPTEGLGAAGPLVGVDLNDGHLAVRRLDPHGNPAGRAERIEFSLTGTRQQPP